MLTRQTFQIRGYISKEGYARIDSVLADCCDLYNRTLQDWINACKKEEESHSLFDLIKKFTQIRRHNPDGWGALSVHIGRGVLIRFDKARQAFFRRLKEGEKPGFPRFKKPYRYRTIEIEDGAGIMLKYFGRKGNHHRYKIKIKGLHEIQIKSKRKLPEADKLKVIKLTRKGNILTVGLTFEMEREALPKTGKVIGLDMGVETRIMTSKGQKIERRVPDQELIAKQQRRMSACRKESIEFRKRRRILANTYRKTKVRNRNECHRITTELIKENDIIAIEDLETKKMTEKGGKRKTRLNRGVLAQTWHVIRQQLTYKAEWAGRNLVVVNPAYTSQECSGCGNRAKKMLSERQHSCRKCGLSIDRDHNAAIVILTRALTSGGNFPEAVPGAA